VFSRISNRPPPKYKPEALPLELTSSAPSDVRTVKYRKQHLVGHVAVIGSRGMPRSCRIMVEKSLGKHPLGRLKKGGRINYGVGSKVERRIELAQDRFKWCSGGGG
jgi:hypothetical protein